MIQTEIKCPCGATHDIRGAFNAIVEDLEECLNERIKLLKEEFNGNNNDNQD